MLQYFLMHKDQECGTLILDEKFGRILEYHDNRNGMSPYLGTANIEKIRQWWELRAIPNFHLNKQTTDCNNAAWTVGFSMFPLSDSGYAGTFQDKMHIFSTMIVVLLSIVSLVLIIIAGAKDKSCRSYGVFAATGFQAVLGIYLYRMELNN